MTEEKAHYAKTEVSDKTYQVFYNGDPILESDQVVELVEHYDGKDFPAVIYFSESAISALETFKTEYSTHCPIKGDASYWSYKEAENGIWSYEDPLGSVAQLKNHFSFDQKKGFQVKLTV